MTRTGIIWSTVIVALALVAGAVYLMNDDGGAAAPADATEIVFDGGGFESDFYQLPIAEQGRQDVSIVVRNQDPGRAHAIGIYPQQGTQPLIDQPIIETDPVEGQAQRVFTFQAPEQPGLYFLRCTIHTDEVSSIRFERP